MATHLNGKILVIDDEIGPRESLRILLKTQYEIVTADRVDAGINYLKEQTFDLIIMDIRMPGKSGIEGLREIREINPTISVIMLTGYGALETAQEAIRHGANDYLKKPFDMHEIQEVIKKNVARTRLKNLKADASVQINELTAQLNENIKARDTMAEMGMASAELVHDLRSPLGNVKGYIDLMKMEMSHLDDEQSSKELESYLSQMETQLNHCSQLTEDWYNLGKNEPDHLEKVNTPELISALVSGINQSHPAIKIEVPALAWESFCIQANKSQIIRVFQNVFDNSVSALATSDPKKISIIFNREGNRVTTTIKDSGCGIKPEHIERIFNPLASFSEGPQKGLGLGLFIAKKIVENHKGSIQIANGPDQGAVVTISLPAAI